MADNGRREFLKRLGIGSAVAAGSLGFVVATSPKHHRGQHLHGNGVVVGNSRKDEVLYQKTQNWEQFYKSAL
ncbi:MAG: twin-arginine translocation signal domain-containing protein [Campylobacterales bacterium]|jgi:hypothetical protein|nr:twin-arginine translocation signal domain-containing protein [Campylobacterales bacterium]